MRRWFPAFSPFISSVMFTTTLLGVGFGLGEFTLQLTGKVGPDVRTAGFNPELFGVFRVGLQNKPTFRIRPWRI
jgi:hypothetical protein